MGRLTVAMLRALSEPGRYGDGGTLFLNVAPSGSKSWIQRITINGRRRDVGLGGWPVVSLAKARERAFANRVAIADGRDPLAEKRRANVPTFRQAAGATLAANRPRWRSGKTASNWTQQLERHAFGALGDLPVDRIGREDVLKILVPLWTGKPEIARKLRNRIRATMAWAQAHGYVEHNVAGEAIDGALPAQPGVKAHFRALSYREVGKALEVVRASRASMPVKLAFEFLVLTAARSGEVRLARWTEIDPDNEIWTVPADRMKTKREHRVPLSDRALEVLNEARKYAGGSGLVFPSLSGRALSDATMSKLLREQGIAAVPHGFRSSFRDWCADTGKPREIAEAALAHTVGGVEGAYFRSDLFERRRRLMDQWAAFVTGGSARVVRFRG